MLKRLNEKYRELSLTKKTYSIILLSISLLMLFFLFIMNVLVSDLEDAIISKSTQTMNLICADLDSYGVSLQNVASHILRNDFVKNYTSSGSTPSSKRALQSQMSRNAYNNNYFNIPSGSGISGFMVLRNEEDYVYSNSSAAFQQDAYQKLAAYVAGNYSPAEGEPYLILPTELSGQLDFLCFAQPIFDSDSTSTLRSGGTLVLFVSRYSIMKTLAKYYSDDFSVFIADSRGSFVFHSGSEETLPSVSPEPGGTVIRDGSGDKRIIAGNRLKNINWTVYLQTPLKNITSQLRGYQLMMFLVVLFIIAISFFMVQGFSRSITSRLTEMTDVISAIREGDMDSRYPVVYHDEISLIGSEFNHMVDQIQNYHLNAAMQELRQKEAELHALQSNINPHFLYNALDCIRSSALVNGDMRTAHQIQILANMFRYTVTSGAPHSETVTVEAELNHVYDYLSMLAFRFEDRYFVDVRIANRVLPLFTQKLILQPVVENAFHHGVRHMASGGRVQILGDLDEEEKTLRFTVEDNGAGIPAERLSHLQSLLGASPLSNHEESFMALVNINDRIRIAYGKEYGVTLESEENRFTRVTVRVPVIREKEETVHD